MKAQPLPEPKYDHLLEVLDGAASLHMAILQAEEALMEPSLPEEERTILESVLDASRDRYRRITGVIRSGGSEPVESVVWGEAASVRELSEDELHDAGRSAEEGSPVAERDVMRAIERLGRSLKLSARSSIEEFLSHPSPQLRASSMKVLTLHWRLREYTENVLWSLASDDEPDCRRAAALSLGSMYQGTRDREVGRELVIALRREGEEQDVRWASYYALLSLEGKSESDLLRFEQFDAQRDVDPRVLARYA